MPASLELIVEFDNQTSTRVSSSAIKNHLKLVLQRLGWVGTVAIEVLIVENSAIKQLNQKFLGSNQITDVLSFPAAPDQKSELLGSIVIAEKVAAAQAAEAGIDQIEEIKLLAGHGLLHLAGYHHA